MARYTSTGEGSGSLTVAIWDVESTKVETGTDCVSPSDEEYGKGTGAVTGTSNLRENASDWMLALTMTNNSAVKADVTVTLAEGANIGMMFDEDFTWGIGWTGEDDIEYDGTTIVTDDDGYTIAKSGRAQTNKYATDLMAKFGDGYTTDDFISLVNEWDIFSLQLASDGEGTGAGETLTIKGIDEKGGAASTADVYCEVVWTSIYGGNNNFEKDYTKLPDDATFTDWAEFSDAVDTIIGMYVTGLSFNITWTATQASVQPTEG